jgi:hypothetical protein
MSRIHVLMFAILMTPYLLLNYAYAEKKQCLGDAATLEQTIALAEKFQLLHNSGRFWTNIKTSADGKVATLFFMWEHTARASVYTYIDGCLYAIDSDVDRTLITQLLENTTPSQIFPEKEYRN